MAETLSKVDTLDDIRAFISQEIAPYASAFEREDRLSRDLIIALGAKRYLGAPFPEVYGGLGMDPRQYGQLTEEVGKVCCATRTLLTVHTSLIGETILRWGTEEQKTNFLPLIATGKKIGAFALSEPLTGSDAKHVHTVYRKEGSDYIINGSKKWISLGGIADVFLVIAADQGNVTAFLVDGALEGIQVKPMQGLMAGRATHIAELEFKEVRVSGQDVLGREGAGFTYIVNTALDFGRFSIAWGGLGLAQASLEAMVKYSRRRKQFGGLLCGFQLVQQMIAEALADIHACRALCEKVSDMRKMVKADAIQETVVAKYCASRIANRVSSAAVQLHGANGISSEYPVERLFREAKVLEIIEGTTQVLQQVMAEYALRRY
jgi:alkylation response protein AidB-like acyl-CoA dehydrogenase